MADEMKHDTLEHRAAGNFYHRFWNVFGHRTKPRAFPASHQDRNIGFRRSTDEVAQKMNAEKTAVAVEHRHVPKRARLHEIEHGHAISLGTDCEEVSRHHLGDRRVHRLAGEKAAANVAIRDEADDAARFVLHQNEFARVRFDRPHGVANGRRLADHEMQGFDAIDAHVRISGVLTKPTGN
ncbi:MAG TPA: hypothetical protein VHD59_12385 [Pseudolabrys sp.]|nr:hypothetical protein [Pseudolabrys sp.]